MPTMTDDPEAIAEGAEEDDNVVPMNGKSIEDRADEGEHEEPEDDGNDQFVIPGTGTSLTLTAGGRRPDVSEAKLKAIPLAIKGEFKKGDTIRVMVDVVCSGVHIKDEMKNGEIQRTRRTHHFTPEAVEVVSVE